MRLKMRGVGSWSIMNLSFASSWMVTVCVDGVDPFLILRGREPKGLTSSLLGLFGDPDSIEVEE